jgi:hypothetical protein
MPEGWLLESIEAHRAQVPDEENAALLATAIRQFTTPDWPLMRTPPPPGQEGLPETDPRVWVDRFNELSPEVQLDEATLRGLQASLAKVEPARALARKLIGMKSGRYPLQWMSNPILTVLQSQDARTATTVLRYEAALASQNGDADGALACARGIVAAARSVGDEPTLISMLIRVACDQQAVFALERALAQGEPSAGELEAMQQLLEQELTEPILLRGMRGERAAMHQVLLGLRAGDIKLTSIAGGPTGFEDAFGPMLARRSHGRMLRLLNEAVAAAALPPEEQAPVFKGIEQRVMKAKVEYDVVTALLMPAILKVSEANRRWVGNLRCAIVALALERYRRDHGRWPDSLDALVPKYLAAVPIDPGDDKPIRLARRPDGLTVYWVGQDGADDGGKLDRRVKGAKGTDEGFQLWDVKHRRQPPPKEPPKPEAPAP